MAHRTCCLLIGLVCAARGSPLGSIVSDATAILPNLLPNTGGTTVCDSIPNVVGIGYGPLGLNIQSPLGLPLLPSYGLQVPGIGASTVYDTKQGITAIPLLPPYGLPVPGVAPTSANEAPSNIPAIPYPLPYGLTLPASTTVCESSPNVVSQLSVPIPELGTSTVCESTPNIGPYILPSRYGLPLPRIPSVGTKYEAIPNIVSYGGISLPCGVPVNGLTVGSLGIPIL